MWKGNVVSIYITPVAGNPTQAVDSVHAVPGFGLVGDRYYGLPGEDSTKSASGKEITLIEIEAIEALHEHEKINLSAGDIRRNIVTRGVPLNHLVGRQFRVGEVKLLGIRLCEPCQYLANMTDARVLPALIHRGGLRASILAEGFINVGDVIEE